MSKEIWLGPVLSNNRERLLARCAEYISRGETNRLLYIAASSPLLNLVTERLLDGKSAHGVWGEFPVYLFRGFVRRILSEAFVSEPRAVATGSGKRCDEFSASLVDPVATARGSDIAGLLPRVPIDRDELPLRKSLISQIIKQLSAARKLKAIKRLANRDGCVNTFASLIGELQRAGKTADEFTKVVEARARDANQAQGSKSKVEGPTSQLDFDRDVALVYSTYVESLNRFGLTDADADQLRALQTLRGEVALDLRLLDRDPAQLQINNLRYSVPWLEQIELLVLDGFFDFTPVQGEILRRAIPLIPNVIINVNHDERNEDIFRPFQATIDQLTAIAPFEIVKDRSGSAESSLCESLFNSLSQTKEHNPADTQINNLCCTLLECSDRELEMRSIAKEIKALILRDGYKLSEIALVVRERASYAETILRVFADESVPCNLERRVAAIDAPAVRACEKLLQLLKQPREDLQNPKASDIAHLIKTGYFQPTREHLEVLRKSFDESYGSVFATPDEGDEWRAKLSIGSWRPDNFENAIAYVGSELRVKAWIDRAHKIIKVFPSAEDAQSLISGEEAEDPAATAADEAPPEDGAVMDRRQKPTPIHPAAIGWSVLLIKHFAQLLSSTPDEGTPEELRVSLMLLLDKLEFATQINEPFNQPSGFTELPQATLNVRGRESLRRAIAAAVRSLEYANQVVHGLQINEQSLKPASSVSLSVFIDEVERSLRSQVLAFGAASRDGLQVLEATDIRGLRFRAVFIAGMIEGGFPMRMSRDWLYPHEERVRLQKHGVFLEDISTETLLKEEHYFYQAACRATERLYLTRPLTLDDGTETVASYYIDELRRALQPNPIEEKQIRGDVDGHDLTRVSTSSELVTILIRQGELANRHSANGKLDAATIEGLLAKAEEESCFSSSALRRVQVEQERNGNSFGPYDGVITNAGLRQMLARHFGPEHVYSASRLSSYGNCAFRFFANRVLRIEPRSEAALDLQAIDAGKLLHDILRRFFENHRREYLPARDREQLRRELAETADAVFQEHEDKVPPLNDRVWKIDCEIRKLILDQVLLYELKLQEKTNRRGMRPTHFELAFGRSSMSSDPGSKDEYLRLERQTSGEQEQALIQGQIDRVDVSDDGRTAIAYDYKLSKGARLEDIEGGREVQLPIYLAALEQLFFPHSDLAGGGYYTLRAKGSRLNQGLYRAMFADCTSISPQAHKSRLADDEWRRIREQVVRHVWNSIDGMRGGHFRVKPALGKTTCKFCDYSAVCRYDAYRINRKN